MAKSFVAGAMVGLVVSGAGAAALSLLIGPPQAVTPRPDVEISDLPSVAPQSTDADQPDVGEPGLAVPQTAQTQPATVASPELPSEPVVDTPEPETSLQMSAESSAPAAPVQPDPVAKPIDDALALDMSAPAVDDTGPEIPSAPRPELAVPAPVATRPAAPEQMVSATDEAQAEPGAELSTATPEPPLPMPAPVPAPVDLPTIGTAPVETTETAPQVSSDTGAPSIGAPAQSLVDRDGPVPKRRLPSIGSAPLADTTDTETGPLPPLVRYAAAADIAEGEPLMSVVLIDDGAGPLGPDMVGDLPFPVSFAVSSSHPNAAAAARAYRAAGFEVLAMAGVPKGAQASDVEVSLEGALGAVPEAIGVLEDPASGLQETRSVSEQAAQFLRDTGHGLLMMSKGMGTGEALAQRVGVPTAQVFRDFDGAGQDPRVMRRFLDQAAFRARQEGSVVMLGRLRADTLTALVIWGLQDRASSVALVPVSAIMTQGAAPG
ncbi:divergent polysaccharide deacetylase family protein [Citreicella sp. C3M06]|uniref:divergent polysaccharide deacetylase family protein n=1 Tax=Citreicella sp. C3M06 TaxID=2841564 RepID=UPI001C09912F|nr:divergent polysaccharide deacetylase family protein [Citreicella sp. C3M06]MBU2962168.1 divergent polysaccharide deacetylase family protein [Citreicella sp. C3M06]